MSARRSFRTDPDRPVQTALGMAESRPAPHPRLAILFAARAPVAVIFRRGPSKRVEVIRWDTAHDTFERGHWFHGRIYTRRCDLSPDGELLVYFASKFNRRTVDDRKVWIADDVRRDDIGFRVLMDFGPDTPNYREAPPSARTW